MNRHVDVFDSSTLASITRMPGLDAAVEPTLVPPMMTIGTQQVVLQAVAFSETVLAFEQVDATERADDRFDLDGPHKIPEFGATRHLND